MATIRYKRAIWLFGAFRHPPAAFELRSGRCRGQTPLSQGKAHKIRDRKTIGSGALQRPKREELLAAVRRREVDAILVWRLDRWGRSLPDLVVTLKELAELGIGFVSLTEAFDMTTPTGRALAGMLAVFAEFEREIMRERVKAGIAQARAKG